MVRYGAWGGVPWFAMGHKGGTWGSQGLLWGTGEALGGPMVHYGAHGGPRVRNGADGGHLGVPQPHRSPPPLTSLHLLLSPLPLPRN